MPGFDKAGALLVGTGRHHQNSGLAEVPSVATTLDGLREVLVGTCGVDPGGVRVLLDPLTPLELGEAIATFAESAGDPLLLYYVGHGLISENGDLHLATVHTDSRTTRVKHTALPYDVVRSNLLHSAARSIVVVLDCCFAGRGLQFLSRADEQLAGMADIEVDGGFVLTSAGRNELVLVPKGKDHTAFTGQLLRLLTEGDPLAPREITLEAAYLHLARKLPAANCPRPQRSTRGLAGDLVLAPNPAYRPRPSAAPVPSGKPAVSGATGVPESPRRLHRTLLWVALVIMLSAASVAVWLLRPREKPMADPSAPSPTSTVVTPPPSTSTSSSPANPVVSVARTAPASPAATGQTLTGAPAAASLTTPAPPPVPAIVIRRGAATSSSACQKPDCSWIDAQLTGFQPFATYRVYPFANGHVFSEPCVAQTDANGAATCDDVRYDVPDTTVYEYIDTSSGRVRSNDLYWAPAG